MLSYSLSANKRKYRKRKDKIKKPNKTKNRKKTWNKMYTNAERKRKFVPFFLFLRQLTSVKSLLCSFLQKFVLFLLWPSGQDKRETSNVDSDD